MPKRGLSWIVVADSARARIFTVSSGAPGLTEIEDLVSDNRRSGEIDVDRPGRTFDSADIGRHAKVPRTDPHRHEKARFAAQLAEKVNAAVLKGKFDDLVLVAPPEALGDLRKELCKQAHEKLSSVIEKDLTRVSAHDLPARLGDAIPPLTPPPRAR